jgi:N-acyl-L-homoserine lactone synthetase
MSVTSGGRPAARTNLVAPVPTNGLNAAAVAELDRLATALQRRAAPVRFALAETVGEREAIFRLRHDVVVERRWAAPETMSGGLERDADDDHACFVAGWDGERLVACARLIFPATGRRLPVERIFDLTVEPAGQVMSIDRLIVARSHSDPRHRVMAGLVTRCWQEAAARGFQVAAGIDSKPMLRLYRLIGVHATVLGPARAHWNEERFPVRIDVGEALPSLIAGWRRLAGLSVSSETA